MSQNIWLAFPALTALIIQGWLFVNSNKRNLIKQSYPLVLLYISLFGICILELLTYTKILPPSLIMMKLFYVSCFVGLTGIVIQGLNLHNFSISSTLKLQIAMLVICIAISISLLFSGNLISGFSFISYSYTREPSPYYWIVQI